MNERSQSQHLQQSTIMSIWLAEAPCGVRHQTHGAVIKRAPAHEICPKYQNIKEPGSLLGTLCESLISQSCACVEEAGPWPSALKARGLHSRVLLELLIIPLPDPPNSNSSLFI